MYWPMWRQHVRPVRVKKERFIFCRMHVMEGLARKLVAFYRSSASFVVCLLNEAAAQGFVPVTSRITGDAEMSMMEQDPSHSIPPEAPIPSSDKLLQPSDTPKAVASPEIKSGEPHYNYMVDPTGRVVCGTIENMTAVRHYFEVREAKPDATVFTIDDSPFIDMKKDGVTIRREILEGVTDENSGSNAWQIRDDHFIRVGDRYYVPGVACKFTMNGKWNTIFVRKEHIKTFTIFTPGQRISVSGTPFNRQDETNALSLNDSTGIVTDVDVYDDEKLKITLVFDSNMETHTLFGDMTVKDEPHVQPGMVVKVSHKAVDYIKGSSKKNKDLGLNGTLIIGTVQDEVVLLNSEDPSMKSGAIHAFKDLKWGVHTVSFNGSKPMIPLVKITCDSVSYHVPMRFLRFSWEYVFRKRFKAPQIGEEYEKMELADMREQTNLGTTARNKQEAIDKAKEQIDPTIKDLRTIFDRPLYHAIYTVLSEYPPLNWIKESGIIASSKIREVFGCDDDSITKVKRNVISYISKIYRTTDLTEEDCEYANYTLRQMMCVYDEIVNLVQTNLHTIDDRAKAALCAQIQELVEKSTAIQGHEEVTQKRDGPEENTLEYTRLQELRAHGSDTGIDTITKRTKIFSHLFSVFGISTTAYLTGKSPTVFGIQRLTYEDFIIWWMWVSTLIGDVREQIENEKKSTAGDRAKRAALSQELKTLDEVYMASYCKLRELIIEFTPSPHFAYHPDPTQPQPIFVFLGRFSYGGRGSSATERDMYLQRYEGSYNTTIVYYSKKANTYKRIEPVVDLFMQDKNKEDVPLEAFQVHTELHDTDVSGFLAIVISDAKENRKEYGKKFKGKLSSISMALYRFYHHFDVDFPPKSRYHGNSELAMKAQCLHLMSMNGSLVRHRINPST